MIDATIPLNEVLHGDSLDVLKSLPDDSVDSLVTDPPAGINFMNKDFDKDRGGRAAWVSWLTGIMQECYRVLKPGAHGLIWALPRTSHWTALALEDANFEIRDCVYHIFGSGFPKSHDISKAIDRMAGVEREIIGHIDGRGLYDGSTRTPRKKFTGNVWNNNVEGGTTLAPITAPATPDAQAWEGWGTALKPSVECWWLVRKPIAESSIAANVLEWGTGGLNIDACRIAHNEDLSRINKPGINGWANHSGGPNRATYDPVAASGRWPAHLLLTHSLFCDENDCAEDCPARLMDEQSGIRKDSAHVRGKAGSAKFNGKYANGELYSNTQDQIGGYNDQGGASRYFQQFYYTPKASRKERNRGCEALPAQQTFDKNTSRQIAHINHSTGETTYNDYHPSSNSNNHPTVKSIDLMRYLVRLITPPDGIVLDPFGGSGSTALACIQENKRFILIEKEQEYIEIAQARINHALNKVGEE